MMELSLRFGPNPRKIIKKKRPLALEEQQLLAPPTKQIKFDNINNLIDGPIKGSGIFLD